MNRRGIDLSVALRRETSVRVGRGLGAASVTALVASCTGIVGGSALPAPGLAPHPVLGETLKKVLANAGQLTAALHQPVWPSNARPPMFGGIDTIPNGLFSNPKSGPRECLGIVLAIQQNSYRSADAAVQQFASSEWNVGQSMDIKAFLVAVSAVGIDTASGADAVFATFSRQWSHCNDTTVTVFDPNSDKVQSTDRITGVRVADSIISATVQAIDPDGSSLLVTRALGVRVNCIIETTVIYAGDPGTGAVDIAHAMLDNVSKVS